MAQGSMTESKIYLTVYMRRVHFDPRSGSFGGGIFLLNGLIRKTHLIYLLSVLRVMGATEYGPTMPKNFMEKFFEGALNAFKMLAYM